MNKPEVFFFNTLGHSGKILSCFWARWTCFILYMEPYKQTRKVWSQTFGKFCGLPDLYKQTLGFYIDDKIDWYREIEVSWRGIYSPKVESAEYLACTEAGALLLCKCLTFNQLWHHHFHENPIPRLTSENLADFKILNLEPASVLFWIFNPEKKVMFQKKKIF